MSLYLEIGAYLNAEKRDPAVLARITAEINTLGTVAKQTAPAPAGGSWTVGPAAAFNAGLKLDYYLQEVLQNCQAKDIDLVKTIFEAGAKANEKNQDSLVALVQNNQQLDQKEKQPFIELIGENVTANKAQTVPSSRGLKQ